MGRPKRTLEQCQEYARSREGECAAKNYINEDGKLPSDANKAMNGNPLLPVLSGKIPGAVNARVGLPAPRKVPIDSASGGGAIDSGRPAIQICSLLLLSRR